MDCSKHCNSIINEMKPISDEIKKLEAEHVNKVHSEEDLEKRNELDKQLEQIQYLYNECRIDCELRNRHRISDEEEQPIDETLIEELNELNSDDDDDDDDNPSDGGNKRQSRRRHRRRRRSIRNKTKQKHSRRRHTRNARRRGRGQRTRRDKK